MENNNTNAIRPNDDAVAEKSGAVSAREGVVSAREGAISVPATAAAIKKRMFRLIQAVIEETDAVLPDIRLLPGERMTRNGSLFREGQPLVRAVCWALRDGAELYPDIPVNPDKLAARQDRAIAWLRLEQLFTRLAQRARDAYLLDQSEAIQQAMGVVSQVRADETQPFPPPRKRERALGMVLPERILQGRQLRRKKAEKKAQLAKAAATDGASASAKPKKPHGAAHRQAIREYRQVLSAQGAAARGSEMLDDLDPPIGS